MEATNDLSLLRAGSISSEELTKDAIARIERLNPLVNAVVSDRFEHALAESRASDSRRARSAERGPLEGLPILIKDLFDFRPGMRHTFGSAIDLGFEPQSPSPHVERLEAAGAIVLGKTNTPEFGHKGTTDNPKYGPTHCPFALGRNAGGSSGGSAAGVATGMTTLAQGSDAGGSVRIPASCCGVVGFKATYGRIPNAGGPNAFSSHTPFVHAGALATSVRDAAMMTRVMTGPHEDDPFSLPAPSEDWLSACQPQQDLALKVAFSPDLGGFPIDPAVRQVVAECVASLADTGVTVSEIDFQLPAQPEELANLWRQQVGMAYVELFEGFVPKGGDPIEHFAADLPDTMVQMMESARSLSAIEFRRRDQMRTAVWRSLQQCVFANYDLLLCPTLAALPPKNDSQRTTVGPTSIHGSPVEPTIGWCLTFPFNFTGHPAISVPAGQTEGNLPVGVQIVGRRFREVDVLRVAGLLEEARPWSSALQRMRSELEILAAQA